MNSSSDRTYNANFTALVNWFTSARNANAPESEELRCKVLGLLLNPIAYAVKGDTIVVQVNGGLVLARRSDAKGCDIVEFDYVSDTRYEHVNFWMNASSVRDIGQRLRARHDLRTNDFDALFVGARAYAEMEDAASQAEVECERAVERAYEDRGADEAYLESLRESGLRNF